MKKKQEEKPKKFGVKKRVAKEKPNFFENSTIFRHPLANAFEGAPKLELVDAPADETDTPASTPATTPTSTRPIFPVAPASNFQKVTNTITKEAIPQRLFRTGKTKEIYDVLYSLTRGAIKPRRIIVISKPNLRKLTGVGSRITIDTCLGYLEIVGLVKITKNASGQHEGNEYEVFTPEEIGTGTSTPASTGGTPAQTLGVVAGVDTRRGSQGSEPTNTGIIDTSKTSFKDINTIDDVLTRRLNEFSQKKSGRDLTKADREKIPELVELLIGELETAAARTDSISNVPAFLTEHLRRKLSKSSTVEKPVISAQTNKKPSKISGVVDQEYEAEPLSEQGREAVLQTFREYKTAGKMDYVLSQKGNYTELDWKYLMKELEK